MIFSSIEKIKEHFELSGTNHSEIKNELLDIIKKIHPDKNGGEFRTKADEKYYFEIQSAIDFIDGYSSLPVTKTEFNALTKILKEILPQNQSKPQDNIKLLETKISSSIKIYKGKHLFPKITTTTITVVLTAIWLFPNTVSEHPVLKHYFYTNSPFFGMLWFTSIFFCVITWIILKTTEKRDEDLKRGLSLETNLNKLFTRFLSYTYHGEIKDEFFYFSKDGLIDFIMDYDFKTDTIKFRKFNPKRNILDIYRDLILRIIPLDSSVDIELAQSVSDVIIDKGLAKNVIEKVDSESIADTFRTKYHKRTPSPSNPNINIDIDPLPF